MCLYRKYNDILLTRISGLVDGFRLGSVYLAVMPLQRETILLDCGEMRALIDHGDILARECEFCGKQAAD